MYLGDLRLHNTSLASLFWSVTEPIDRLVQPVPYPIRSASA